MASTTAACVLNDICEYAIAISDGATPFATTRATTEFLPANCKGGNELFFNDIWFLYTAPCTGFATFSLCNDADFDTVMAVYFAGNCSPQINPLACSNDAAGCGVTSEIQQFVVETVQYLVRIGGINKGGGFGVLTVSCEPRPARQATRGPFGEQPVPLGNRR